MYTSYNTNMPPNNRVMYPRRNSFGLRGRDDRFFGGGFVVPFILGGIAGSALNSRPYYGYPNQYYYNTYYYPYPYPYPYFYPY